jgi:hypothetical protein
MKNTFGINKLRPPRPPGIGLAPGKPILRSDTFKQASVSFRTERGVAWFKYGVWRYHNIRGPVDDWRRLVPGIEWHKIGISEVGSCDADVPEMTLRNGKGGPRRHWVSDRSFPESAWSLLD